MNGKQTIGIDAAKRVFYLHGEDAGGRVILREKLSRERLLPFLGNQPESTIAIEAGCGAHHWARAFAKLGHEVRLIHAKFVRPFVKTNKNDWNDAAAICEAAQRPTMRFVATKSLEQQDLLAIHRVRERLVSQRTGLCNQIRGLLALERTCKGRPVLCRRRRPIMTASRLRSLCPVGRQTPHSRPWILRADDR